MPKGIYKRTEEHKRKTREVSTFQKGFTPWNKGKKMPQITGENHYLWKSATRECLICGKDFRLVGKRKNAKYCSRICYYNARREYKVLNRESLGLYPLDWKYIRKPVVKRDKNICQLCGKVLAGLVHHIDYDRYNCDNDNMLVLCRSCHAKTNYNRKKWKDCFGLHRAINKIIDKRKFLAMIHEGQNDYSFEQYKKDMIRSFEFDGHLLNELRRTEAF